MNELVPSLSIENLLNKRQGLLECFGHVREEMKKAQALYGVLGLDNYDNLFLGSYSSRGRTECLLLDHFPHEDISEIFTKRLDAQLWNKLIHESGLRSFMDLKAREEWDEAIRNNAVIPLTRENIVATLGSLRDRRGEMMERGVIEVFRRLSWNYKSNLPVKFGKRIIVDFLFESWAGWDTLRLNSRREDSLNDLDRVFRIMDGKPEQDHRSSASWRVSEACRNGSAAFDLDYFSLKGYKKGTGHLTFKKPELVDQLNQILAKHYPNALPSH